MAIKLDEKTKTYRVSYSKRPQGLAPVGLKRKGIKTLVEAKKIEAKLIVEVHELIKAKSIPKWKDVLSLYYKSMQTTDLTNKTVYSREKVLNYHTLQEWGNKFVDDIKTEDIFNLVSGKADQYSEAHRKFILKCIKGVFSFAQEKGFIQRNPSPLLKFKASDKIKAVLTEAQIISLLQKAQLVDWEWYPHCAMAVYTGMRNGELYALTWDKVDLDKRLIKVDCSWSSKDGYKSTKSGDDRVLEIPAPLMPLLQELKLKSAEINFVLPRMNKWDKGEQARELRVFLKIQGLPEIRFHDLRASWATWLLGKGVAPSKVMSMGGWKDMDTMMIYMRKAGIDIRGATSVLDDVKTHGIQSAEVIELHSKQG